ncbi:MULTISPECIES: hypothetical protein [Arachidicoccus]|uniref:hypothetical protein n=1 Tax=Arachidicoccus TaxID=1769012 RepID=UPI0013C4BF7B|nr:hypothetical protein [Arachidicoccus soli]
MFENSDYASYFVGEYEDNFDAYGPSGYSIFNEDQYGNIISANFTQDESTDFV